MKKRIISLLIAMATLVGVASATSEMDFRWSYFEMVNCNINMKNGSIAWFGDADTYMVSDVTLTKIAVKLQVSTGAGWGTIETDTYSSADYTTSAGGTYSNWGTGKAYRVSVEAWCYSGSKELEHVGPLYEYLNT